MIADDVERVVAVQALQHESAHARRVDSDQRLRRPYAGANRVEIDHARGAHADHIGRIRAIDDQFIGTPRNRIGKRQAAGAAEAREIDRKQLVATQAEELPHADTALICQSTGRQLDRVLARRRCDSQTVAAGLTAVNEVLGRRNIDRRT